MAGRSRGVDHGGGRTGASFARARGDAEGVECGEAGPEAEPEEEAGEAVSDRYFRSFVINAAAALLPAIEAMNVITPDMTFPPP